jgi:hypothetical protein
MNMCVGSWFEYSQLSFNSHLVGLYTGGLRRKLPLIGANMNSASANKMDALT